MASTMVLRTLICAPDVLDSIKSRFPNRKIEASIYAPKGSLYWFGKDGDVRMVFKGKAEIWACDHERGYPHMKTIRLISKPII